MEGELTKSFYGGGFGVEFGSAMTIVIEQKLWVVWKSRRVSRYMSLL